MKRTNTIADASKGKLYFLPPQYRFQPTRTDTEEAHCEMAVQGLPEANTDGVLGSYTQLF